MKDGMQIISYSYDGLYGVLIQSFAGLALSLEDDLRLRRGI